MTETTDVLWQLLIAMARHGKEDRDQPVKRNNLTTTKLS